MLKIDCYCSFKYIKASFVSFVCSTKMIDYDELKNALKKEVVDFLVEPCTAKETLILKQGDLRFLLSKAREKFQDLKPQLKNGSSFPIAKKEKLNLGSCEIG